MRIGYEFEGDWNGYQPDTFRAAFIRIASRLHELPNASDIATVWCSGGASAGPLELDQIMQYYPGDEWVDWWGIDTFESTELLSEHTAAFCKAAGLHNCPMMIGESTPRYVGVLDGAASWEKWYAPYFELIHRQPEIKAISYINWDWVHWSNTLGFEWHDWGECRIQQNDVVTECYRAEMQSVLYQHAPHSS